MIAAFGLSGAGAARPPAGSSAQAHAGIVRYVLLLVGVFTILTIIAGIVLGVSPRQLLVGGAVAGVLLGIAAQQSLANLSSPGWSCCSPSPFRVGDQVRFRAGALSGQIEGIVIDLSLTYVRLETEEGRVLHAQFPGAGAASVGSCCRTRTGMTTARQLPTSCRARPVLPANQ